MLQAQSRDLQKLNSWAKCISLFIFSRMRRLFGCDTNGENVPRIKIVMRWWLVLALLIAHGVEPHQQDLHSVLHADAPTLIPRLNRINFHKCCTLFESMLYGAFRRCTITFSTSERMRNLFFLRVMHTEYITQVYVPSFCKLHTTNLSRFYSHLPVSNSRKLDRKL